MNLSRRTMLALVGSAAAGASLAACSGGSSSKTSDGKDVIKAMFVNSTSDRALWEIINKIADDFNASNSFNVEVQVEGYENEQYKTKLASLMASNSQPDVFFTWGSGYLKPFVEGGKVYEIGQLVDKDEEWKARFNESVFGPVTFDGKIYAVPNGQAVAVMYYNTEIFEQVGVSVPTTYEEFVDVVTKVKAAGIVPISVPCKDAWIAGELLQQLANAVGGQELFDGTVDGSRKWNDPQYVEAGTLLTQLEELGAFPDGYQGMTNDEGRDLFTSGGCAMYYMGSWDIAVLSDESLPIAGKISAFNIPAAKGVGENVAVGDIDLAYAVSSTSKNPEAAAAFIKMFSSPEIQASIAADASYLPATSVELDESKLSPLFIDVTKIQSDITATTPWFDRVFGAGEGVEFNNAAQAIIAGEDAAEHMDALQTFAETNATR